MVLWLSPPIDRVFVNPAKLSFVSASQLRYGMLYAQLYPYVFFDSALAHVFFENLLNVIFALC